MSLSATRTNRGLFRVAKTHPNFFWLLTVFASATTIISLTMVFGEHDFYQQPAWNVTRTILPLHFWGFLGLASAACKFIGLTFTLPAVIRWGTALSSLFYLTLGLGLGFAFFLYHSTAPTGMVLWTAIGIVHVLASMEPFTNPANRRD